MANNKRMFNNEITGSDVFLDLPVSTRELYFQLGMRVDDDGFVNPRMLMRMLGVGTEDLRPLIEKRFVLLFNNGVIVLKHHRINNNWDKHNCKETVYVEQHNQLYIKENRAYTLDSKQGTLLSDWKQTGSSLEPVFRIEENRIDKKRIEKIKTLSSPKVTDAYNQEFNKFWEKYPRKIGKMAAYRSWRKIKPSEELSNKIIESIQSHVNSSQWQRDGGNYIPHPSTFLNQGRWDDVIEENRTQKPSYVNFNEK